MSPSLHRQSPALALQKPEEVAGDVLLIHLPGYQVAQGHGGFRAGLYVDQHSWDTREQEENINIRKPNTDLKIINCHVPMHELT